MSKISHVRRDQALREMSSPGKSGSVFFLSHDEKFICKTMNKEEMKMLRRMLHQYYLHMLQFPASLLVRFCGLYRVKPHHGRKVRCPRSLPAQFLYVPIRCRFQVSLFKPHLKPLNRRYVGSRNPLSFPKSSLSN
jgi:hypothetical protein